jgi:membrane associated rhomboid family serine protease
MHILGNMMSAYYLGKLVTMTPSVRPFQIVGLVLGSGICGSLGWLYQQYYRARKSGVIAQRHGLGFSGSVMGLGVVAAMMYPTTTMLIYGIVPVPLWALVGGYFAYDAYYLQQNNTGVAHAGHVGGFAFGVLYYFLSIRRGIWARPRF